MLFRLAADAVLILHALFILFAFFGGLIVLRKKRTGQPYRAWLIVHLLSASWAATVVIMSWTCPLTPLEWQLRLAAGQAGYQSSFIEHYLLAAIYPDGLTRSIQISLGLGVLAFNLIVYGWLILKTKSTSALQ